MTVGKTPMFSVVLPLIDGRGDELGCIRSWGNGQTFPRDRIELILVDGGYYPELRHQAAPLLQPQDQWVESSGSICELYSAGAAHARGEHLFFTELHSFAQPECLGAIADCLAENDIAGACTRSRDRNPTPWAKHQEQVTARQQAIWDAPDHWLKVRQRGFSIHRDAYFAVGGFEGEFLDFAAVVLAARLHQRGYRMLVAENAWVTHVNDADMKALLEHGAEFALGQHRFFLKAKSSMLADYIMPSAEWIEALSLGQQKLFRDVLELRRALPGTAFWRAAWSLILPAVLARTPGTLIGAPWLRARLWFRTVVARLKVRFPRLFRDEPGNAFETLWDLCIRRQTVRLALDDASSAAHATLPPHQLTAADASLGAWLGVHGLEQVGGKPFRWTRPLTRLRWKLPVDQPYEIVIETGGLRSPPRPHLLGACWNGRRIAEDAIMERGDRLHFLVQTSASESDNELFLVCRPLIPSRDGSTDTRVLGLPIFTVAAAALEAGRQATLAA